MAASSRAYCAAIVGSGGGGATHHPAPSLPLLDRRGANDEYLSALGVAWNVFVALVDVVVFVFAFAFVVFRRRVPDQALGRCVGVGATRGATTTISASSTRGTSRICNGGVVIAATAASSSPPMTTPTRGDRTGRVVAIAIAVAASVIPRGRHGRDRSPPDDGSLAEGARRVGAAPSGSPSRR